MREPLDVLLELTRMLADERSLEEALHATTEAALALLPCDHASLRLFDETRHELLSSARSGRGSDRPPVRFIVGQGVLGAVAESGRSALLGDAARDARFTDLVTGFDVRSLIVVPVNAGGYVIGVLSASSPEPDAFAERHRDLAQLLANCTAPAIEAARLARLAVTDDLTRTFNQRYLGTRLEEEIARTKRYGSPFSVLMMDLDHFKLVNDRFGHAVGDDVLRTFVGRVRAEVRSSDVLIRRGGEEFMLLMPGTTSEEARTVAERIRMHVAQSPLLVHEGVPVSITVSIGVASWVEHDDGATIERRADAALYRAKDEGRDRVACLP